MSLPVKIDSGHENAQNTSLCEHGKRARNSMHAVLAYVCLVELNAPRVRRYIPGNLRHCIVSRASRTNERHAMRSVGRRLQRGGTTAQPTRVSTRVSQIDLKCGSITTLVSSGWVSRDARELPTDQGVRGCLRVDLVSLPARLAQS
jgi:hypothetical protein